MCAAGPIAKVLRGLLSAFGGATAGQIPTLLRSCPAKGASRHCMFAVPAASPGGHVSPIAIPSNGPAGVVRHLDLDRGNPEGQHGLVEGSVPGTFLCPFISLTCSWIIRNHVYQTFVA